MSFYGYRNPGTCKVQRNEEVVVVKGRKVPLGTKGKVFWIGQPFTQGMSRFALTSFPIGIRDNTGQVHWTYDQNVKPVETV